MFYWDFFPSKETALFGEKSHLAPFNTAVMQHTGDPDLEKIHQLCIIQLKMSTSCYHKYELIPFLRYYIKRSDTCRFSCTKSASLFANAVSRILLCSLKAALDWLRPISFPRSCSSSRANFLLTSSKRFIFFLKPRDSWSYSQRKKQNQTESSHSRLLPQKIGS